MSIEQLRGTLRQKSKKVKRGQSKLDGSLKCNGATVVTSESEDFNLMFTNHGKEDRIYPLIRDSKAQNKDQRSIVTTCKHTYKGFAFSTY